MKYEHSVDHDLRRQNQLIGTINIFVWSPHRKSVFVNHWNETDGYDVCFI